MAVYWVLQELLHQPFSWLMTRGAVRTRKGAISELIQLVGRDDELQTESDGQAEHGEGADVALDVLPHTSFILGRRLHTFHSEHLWKSGIKIFTAKHASRVVVVVFTLAFRLPNVTYIAKYPVKVKTKLHRGVSIEIPHHPVDPVSRG